MSAGPVPALLRLSMTCVCYEFSAGRIYARDGAAIWSLTRVEAWPVVLGESACLVPLQATPQKAILDSSPKQGFGKLSPARWGWGKGSKRAAGRNLAAETCSPLRDGASAMSHGEATPKGRRRLSPKKMSPWLGK